MPTTSYSMMLYFTGLSCASEIDIYSCDNPFSMEDKHKEELKRRCRVCNKLVEDETCNKFKFREEFHLVFHIDIDRDHEEIHPPYLCQNHKTLMYRARSCLAKGKSFSTNVAVYNFVEHSSCCSICVQSSCAFEHSYSSEVPESPNVGRPSKRKGGPGRGNEGNTKLFIANPDDSESPPEKQKTDLLLASFNELDSIEKLCFLQKLCKALTDDERILLAFEMGIFETENVRSDIQAIKSLYKDLDFLKTNNDYQQYAENRNKTVLSFLKGVAGVNDESDNSTWYQLCHILESIYGVSNSCFVAPMSFLHNLVTYSISGSRLVATMNATTGPYGSFPTISGWLDKMACTPPECPNGCIISVFDNDQVIGRRYQVTPNNRLKTSVITNCAWVQIDKDSDLQNQDLLPHNWFRLDGFEDTIVNLRDGTLAHHELLEDIHYEQLYYVLDGVIKTVKEEQKLEQGCYTDRIDTLVADKIAAEGHKPCPNCGALVKKGKHYCDNPNCNVHLRTARETAGESNQNDEEIQKPRAPKVRKIGFEIDEQTNAAKPVVENYSKESGRYTHVPSNHPDDPPLVRISDPLFVNPNSYQNLTLLLRKLGKDAGVESYGGTQRKWLIVCCDGLPYHMLINIVKETRTCALCQSSFMGKNLLQKHFNESHENEEVKFHFEFDWAVLKIGSGHFEMNMVKSFTELNWIPLMEHLCETMGFKSETAKASAKKCNNHHKAWSLILIFHMGTLSELVVEYVRECLVKGATCCAKEFIAWARKSNKPCYLYALEQVCRYSQAIINFRMGIRRNNHLLAKAGKFFFKECFYGRNHPKYQAIEVHDTLQYQVLPEKVQKLLDDHTSISKSGDKSKGEDCDFVLEELNKETKKWLPRGVPKEKVWYNVCRNLENLQSLREQLMRDLGLTQESQMGYRNIDVEPGIEAWRMELRKSNILKSDSFNSINGKPLDSLLLQFTLESMKRRAAYINKNFLRTDEEIDSELNHPVYVTPNEREHYNCIENKSIKDLNQDITQSLEKIEDDSVYQAYSASFSEIRGKGGGSKPHLVSLLKEIYDVIDNQCVIDDTESEICQ